MSNSGLELGRFLQVTGAFGWGENGSLVVNEALKKEGRRLNGSVSKIVGFTIYNCAAEKENSLVPLVFEIPIRRWKQNEANPAIYDEVPQILKLKPGDSAIIEANDFIAYILNNRATHGRTLENGVIKRSSRGGKSMPNLEKLAHYTPDEAEFFCFSFSPNCVPKRRLHDPEVKKNIGRKVDGVWKVKDEYKEYFGFLEVTKPNSRKVRKLVQQQIAEKIRARYQLNSS